MTDQSECADLLAAALVREHFESFLRMCFAELNPGATYEANWHIKAIAYQLEWIRTGQIRRLIICMPPRSLKSLSASIAFPAFIHGHNPSKHIIAVSYGQDLAAKFQNDYRAVLDAPWYRALFPNTRINRRKDTESEVLLTGRGTRLATSIGGTLTGRGADIIVIDDPLKPSDAYSEAKRSAVNDWFGSTLLSRLNDKASGAIVIVTQRVHAHDLVGHVLETSGEDWTVVNLPAIAPTAESVQVGEGRFYTRGPGALLHAAREGLFILEGLRRDIGSDAFEAQYQQCPVPPGGAMFKRRWIQRYEIAPICEDGDTVIQSWDTASKTGPANDWSVCTTWLIKKNHYHLLDVQRHKLDYPALRDLALDQARKYRARIILIEDTGVGTGLIADLRKAGFDATGVTPETSKEARASVQSSKFEGGRIHFPERASWLPDLEAELMAFPGSRHDDQVDSITQALAYEPPAEVQVFVGRSRRPRPSFPSLDTGQQFRR